MRETRLQRLAGGLASRPFVYDLVQNLAGQAKVAARLRVALERLSSGRILDVGSSGGGFALRLGVNPVCLDLDLRPLLALRQRGRSATPVASDAAQLPFRDRTFDLTLCVALAHHVGDGVLAAVTSELSRVTSGYLVFLDPIRNDARRISRFLWRYDRGRHPRTAEALLAALERDFLVTVRERFAVYHEYLLCVATPRPQADQHG